VQIIFNRDEIQDNNVASYKVLNIFIYDPSFYVIIFMSYKLLKIIPFLPTLYYGYFLTDLKIDLKSEIHFKSRFSTFKKNMGNDIIIIMIVCLSLYSLLPDLW